MALYRKYRPATFAEVVGQEHVTEPLSRALDSGRINHAYLFSGPRGCGKTSSARILARSLNCVHGPTSTPCGQCDSCRSLAPGGPGNLDVMELDAATNRGVDDMRELRDRAYYAPSESRYRVMIIDEAHMITTEGANALLKIVEEPPEHLIFIFATTEPEKIIGTIRSRTHHYPFHLLTPSTMKGLLRKVCDEENMPVEDAALSLVVRAGGGSPRDSLSVLDQLFAGAGSEGLTYEAAVPLLGVTDASLIDATIEALAHSSGAELFQVIDDVIEAGHDVRRFAIDLLDRLRDLMILQAVPEAFSLGLIDAPADREEAFAAEVAQFSPATLSHLAQQVNEGLATLKGATAPRLLLEIMCARLLLPPAPVQQAVAQAHHASAQQPGQAQAAVSGASQSAGGGASARPKFERKSERLAREAREAEESRRTAQQEPQQQDAPKPERQQDAPAPQQPQQDAPAPQQQQQEAPAPQQQQQEAPVAERQDAPQPQEQEEQAQPRQEHEEQVQPKPEQDKERPAAEPAPEPATQEEPADTAPQQPASAPEPEPEPEVDSSSAEPDFEVIRSRWQQIRKAVGVGTEERKANPVAEIMMAEARPLTIDGGELIVEHTTGALRDRLNDPRHNADIVSAVKDATGWEMAVRCVVRDHPRLAGYVLKEQPATPQSPKADGPAETTDHAPEAPATDAPAAPETNEAEASAPEAADTVDAPAADLAAEALEEHTDTPSAEDEPAAEPHAGEEKQHWDSSVPEPEAPRLSPDAERKVTHAAQAATEQPAPAPTAAGWAAPAPLGGQDADAPAQQRPVSSNESPQRETTEASRRPAPSARPTEPGNTEEEPKGWRRYLKAAQENKAQDHGRAPRAEFNSAPHNTASHGAAPAPDPYGGMDHGSMDDFEPPPEYAIPDAPPPDTPMPPPPEPISEEDEVRRWGDNGSSADLDHRDARTIAMEMLTKELGARPL